MLTLHANSCSIMNLLCIKNHTDMYKLSHASKIMKGNTTLRVELYDEAEQFI